MTRCHYRDTVGFVVFRFASVGMFRLALLAMLSVSAAQVHPDRDVPGSDDDANTTATNGTAPAEDRPVWMQQQYTELDDMFRLVWWYHLSSYGVVLILAGCLCALRFRLDLGSKAAFTIVIFPLLGLLSPLLFGAITSFFFALSYSTADKSMTEVEGMIWGCGLTFACMFGGSQSYMGFM